MFSTAFGVINGYILSKWKFPGSQFIFAMIFLGVFMPPQVSLLPWAWIMGKLHLANSVYGLILIHSIQGISFTTINMPLVRTPMIAPTGLYNNVPTLSPEEAADMVAQACIFKPVRIATRLGITGQVLHALLPRVAQIAMNTSFRMFPDSSAAKGDKGAKPQLSPEAVAMQQMMPDCRIHRPLRGSRHGPIKNTAIIKCAKASQSVPYANHGYC